MHNSPDTPTGTNWEFWPRKYICVLAMGRPIEIGEIGESTTRLRLPRWGPRSTTPSRLPRWGPRFKSTVESILVIVDQIVVSVGPYMFHNSPPRGSSSL